MMSCRRTLSGNGAVIDGRYTLRPLDVKQGAHLALSQCRIHRITQYSAYRRTDEL
jgi:hypothetical protein